MSPSAASPAGITVSVLGSSSSGNATLVRFGDAAILVDCGFPPRYMLQHLAESGLMLDDLAGIFITHIHSDHVNPWFVKRAMQAGVPLYCPPEIELHLQSHYEILARASHEGSLIGMTKEEVLLDNLLVRSFPVPHDSAGGCFGYSIDDGKRKVVVATDIAFPIASAASPCCDADILVIESNHDLKMLEESGRPLWVKKRIRERGHLSNEECVMMLRSIFDRSTRLPGHIMVAHVSKECNTNSIATACAQNFLSAAGATDVRVVETFPAKPSHVRSNISDEVISRDAGSLLLG